MSGVTVTPVGGGLPTGEEPRRASSGRGLARVGLVLFIAAVTAMMVKIESDAVSDPVKKAERGEVDASSVYSLTAPENLTSALEAIDADLPPGGYVENLRVSPGGVDAIVVEESGLGRNLQVDVAFEIESEDFGAADAAGLEPAEIPAGAVERIIEDAEAKYGLQPENFDYATIHTVESTVPPSWSAFWSLPLKDNMVLARLDGSGIYLSGEPPPPAVQEDIFESVEPVPPVKPNGGKK